MDSSTFKTFKAKLYDMTPLGEVLVGKVQVTIDFGDVNERSLSTKFVLKDIIEVEELPTFNILDFPDEADLPAINIQDSALSIHPAPSDVNHLPLDTIVIHPDKTTALPDFQTVDDEFILTNEQAEVLIQDKTVQWVRMNNPAGKLGIEVNEFGEVRSTNQEVYLMEGGDQRMKLSKYNKILGGKLYTVYVYRAGS